MASTFRSVNHASEMPEPANDPPKTLDATSAAVNPQTLSSAMDDATTPTRATFRNSADAAAITAAGGGAALASQKPLPTSPFPQAVQVPEPPEKTLPRRQNSQHSRKSGDSEDVDMNDSDGEDGAGDDAGSDDDSVNADGTKSKNKKKSQRFYCTDYPPCNLSFTRSEHLARHIRKHTGERPFQCHCSRRFSRLDNLRQHAQTVHVNEDIPMDSLAAVSTRFVRQVRQDSRARQSGRARASTAGSVGTPPRGHSKSLSTSSITSIGSLGSYSPRDDPAGRRRPPPLVMADPRSRLSLESYRSAADSQFSYRAPSPSEFSTPTSGTFSTGQSSPRWSGMASPASAHSRAHSMYASGSRTPGRRLSVPSVAGNPFHSPQNRALGRPVFGAGAINASNVGVFSPGAGSMISSPTLSSAGYPRRESMSSAADEAWRRRTWHPDSREYSAGGSRLSNVITPGQLQSAPLPAPAPTPAAAAVAPAPPLALAPNPGQQSTVRLPGIESFDPIPPPGASPRRIPSPMMVDSEMTNTPAHMSDSLAAEDRRLAQWDMGLHRGLTKLDLAANTPPRDSAGAWANEVNSAVQAQAEQVRAQPTVRFEPEPRVVSIPHSTGVPPPSGYRGGYHHQHTMSAPSITTSRESKRHGWYHGPVTSGLSEVPEQPTRGPRVDRMIHPNLANGFTGFPAREPRPMATSSSPRDRDVEMESERPSQPESMRRLEALVAVATSEGSTAAAY